MPFAAIRDEIATQLATVSGIGQTHNRWRFWKDRGGKITLAFSSDILNVWFIRRVGVESVAKSGGAVTRTHIFDLAGFYEFDDANESETTFQNLIDGVMDKFDDSANLGLSNTGDQTESAELIEFGDEMLGDHLCHAVIVRIQVVEDAGC
ncbi:hypothetical protein LCGC14_2526260 [marine sediment metagenome]|uniref:Uncharacterized protein n=1 Tax=marine sediment metagenome TaxID=412755 RepID=A0A0F9DN81_9ZZZZ